MQVTVCTFAILRELSADRTVVELPASARLEDAWAAMADRYPALEAHRSFVRAARAGAYADWETPLADGDEVAFLPPVSGGATMSLTDQPIDVAARGNFCTLDANGLISDRRAGRIPTAETIAVCDKLRSITGESLCGK